MAGCKRVHSKNRALQPIGGFFGSLNGRQQTGFHPF